MTDPRFKDDALTNPLYAVHVSINGKVSVPQEAIDAANQASAEARKRHEDEAKRNEDRRKGEWV